MYMELLCRGIVDRREVRAVFALAPADRVAIGREILDVVRLAGYEGRL